jgi:TolB-like protein
MQYKETNMSIHQIGGVLGVEYVLEGTIRWQRSTSNQKLVRVTQQLVRVSDGINLWADVYETNAEDIFKVQTEIAEQVVDALKIIFKENSNKAAGLPYMIGEGSLQ